jgi:hypothetical protein
MPLYVLHQRGGFGHFCFLLEDHFLLFFHPGFKGLDLMILFGQPAIDILQVGEQGKLELLRLSDLFFLFLYSLLKATDIYLGFIYALADLLFFLLVRVLRCRCNLYWEKRLSTQQRQDQADSKSLEQHDCLVGLGVLHQIQIQSHRSFRP